MRWVHSETPPKVSCEELWQQPSSPPVLAYSSDGTICVATYEINYDDEPTWYTADSERWALSFVTHWMPLPDPPMKEVTP